MAAQSTSTTKVEASRRGNGNERNASNENNETRKSHEMQMSPANTNAISLARVKACDDKRTIITNSNPLIAVLPTSKKGNASPMKTVDFSLDGSRPEQPQQTHLQSYRQQLHSKTTNQFIPSENIRDQDVLCGRGAGANTHLGNVNFRSLVGQYHKTYLSSKPLEKATIAQAIVSKIAERGGRFLKRAPGDKKKSSGFWYTIEHKETIEKTRQALRERSSAAFEVAGVAYPDPRQARNPNRVVGGGTVSVTDNDVLLGRGGITNCHAGNKIFRSLVRSLRQEYLVAPKLKKAAIAWRVVDQIHQKGGRFLVEEGSGHWTEVSKEKAREKTSQAMREKGSPKRQLRQAMSSATLIATGNKKSS